MIWAADYAPFCGCCTGAGHGQHDVQIDLGVVRIILIDGDLTDQLLRYPGEARLLMENLHHGKQ